MRNSSLVEWFCAEDVTGLKHCTEATVPHSFKYGGGDMMYYVYVLQNIDTKKMYYGYTEDLRGRVRYHRLKGVPGYAQGSEWRLVYYEAYLSKSDALRREKALKDGRSAYWLKERIRESIAAIFK